MFATATDRPRAENAAAAGPIVRPEFCPFVSVVIPVYDDAESLKTCLDCLGRQTYPAARCEILVIDNGSGSDLIETVAGRPRICLIQCREPGSYAARNHGIAAARGSVLAFTDADCQAHEDWIASGVAALLREPDLTVLGGHVELVHRQGIAMSAAALHQHVSAFRQQGYVELERYAATANLFTYKSVFEMVGPFDERLYSSGDLEWGQRAHALGVRLKYCPDAVTAHPARTTMRALIQKYVRTTGGHFAVRRLRGQSHFATLAEIARRPVRRSLGEGPHSHLQWWDRVRFLAVEWVIAGARILETLRLLCGGVPRRR
jgi:glycosyltransferase involved in cell wall biosynthesis